MAAESQQGLPRKGRPSIAAPSPGKTAGAEHAMSMPSPRVRRSSVVAAQSSGQTVVERRSQQPGADGNGRTAERKQSENLSKKRESIRRPIAPGASNVPGGKAKDEKSKGRMSVKINVPDNKDEKSSGPASPQDAPRDVRNMRAIYSQARRRYETNFAASTGDPEDKKGVAMMKLKRSMHAVSESSSNVLRGRKIMDTLLQNHAEMEVLRQLEEAKAMLAAGRPFKEIKNRMEITLESMIPDSSERTKILLMLQQASEQLGSLNAQLELLKKRSDMSAAEFEAMFAQLGGEAKKAANLAADSDGLRAAMAIQSGQSAVDVDGNTVTNPEVAFEATAAAFHASLTGYFSASRAAKVLAGKRKNLALSDGGGGDADGARGAEGDEEQDEQSRLQDAVASSLFDVFLQGSAPEMHQELVRLTSGDANDDGYEAGKQEAPSWPSMFPSSCNAEDAPELLEDDEGFESSDDDSGDLASEPDDLASEPDELGALQVLSDFGLEEAAIKIQKVIRGQQARKVITANAPTKLTGLGLDVNEFAKLQGGILPMKHRDIWAAMQFEKEDTTKLKATRKRGSLEMLDLLFDETSVEDHAEDDTGSNNIDTAAMDDNAVASATSPVDEENGSACKAHLYKKYPLKQQVAAGGKKMVADTSSGEGEKLAPKLPLPKVADIPDLVAAQSLGGIEAVIADRKRRTLAQSCAHIVPDIHAAVGIGKDGLSLPGSEMSLGITTTGKRCASASRQKPFHHLLELPTTRAGGTTLQVAFQPESDIDVVKTMGFRPFNTRPVDGERAWSARSSKGLQDSRNDSVRSLLLPEPAPAALDVLQCTTPAPRTSAQAAAAAGPPPFSAFAMDASGLISGTARLSGVRPGTGKGLRPATATKTCGGGTDSTTSLHSAALAQPAVGSCFSMRSHRWRQNLVTVDEAPRLNRGTGERIRSLKPLTDESEDFSYEKNVGAVPQLPALTTGPREARGQKSAWQKFCLQKFCSFD